MWQHHLYFQSFHCGAWTMNFQTKIPVQYHTIGYFSNNQIINPKMRVRVGSEGA